MFLYYYNLAYECDTYPSFPCQTDWKCSGYDAGDDNNVVLVNANGQGVTNRMLGCYLNALYGIDGVDGKGKNEFGEECTYIADKNGIRQKIIPRSRTALSDKTQTVNGVETVVSAGCNSNGVGILQSSTNPFGALCKVGAYQNIFLRPGNTPPGIGIPYDDCTPQGDNEQWCVNAAQLYCTNATVKSDFFSGITQSCNGT